MSFLVIFIFWLYVGAGFCLLPANPALIIDDTSSMTGWMDSARRALSMDALFFGTRLKSQSMTTSAANHEISSTPTREIERSSQQLRSSRWSDLNQASAHQHYDANVYASLIIELLLRDNSENLVSGRLSESSIEMLKMVLANITSFPHRDISYRSQRSIIVQPPDTKVEVEFQMVLPSSQNNAKIDILERQRFLDNFSSSAPQSQWNELLHAYNFMRDKVHSESSINQNIVKSGAVSVSFSQSNDTSASAAPTPSPSTVILSSTNLPILQGILIGVLLFLVFVLIGIVYLIINRKWYFADGECLHWMVTLGSYHRDRSTSELANTFEMNEIFDSMDVEDRCSIKAINVVPLIDNFEFNVAGDYFLQRRLDRVSYSSERMITLVEVEPVPNVYEPRRESSF
jgi:hypothetical protein